MNISRIFRVVLYLVIFIKGASSSNWVDRLVKYLKEDTQIRDIILVMNFDDNSKAPRVDEIFMKLMERFPTMTINMKKDNENENSRTNGIIESDTFVIDSTSTLFVIIEGTKDALATLPSKLTIDAVCDKLGKKSAKFLLVLFTPAPYDSLVHLLKYSWQKSLLDFTILELIESKVTKNLLKVDYTPIEPIVHHYDPFEKKYTRANWTMDVVLFPPKVKNMRGYPLKIGMPSIIFNHLSHRVNWANPFLTWDAHISVLKTIAKELNFTINWVKIPVKDGQPPMPVQNLIASGKIDVFGYPLPQITGSHKYHVVRTTPVKLDRFCALVPISTSTTLPFHLEFFEGYFLCSTIVLMFWALRYLMGFSSRTWQAFNIIQVLLGVSVTRRPTINVERIMFLCLLVISFLYSTNIYTALTHLSLETDSLKVIRTLGNLDDSGLTPVLLHAYYNKTFDHAHGAFENMKHKARRTLEPRKCPYIAGKYKNVTCLMLESTINDVIAQDPKTRERTMIVKECFWSDSLAFLMTDRSHYRGYFDKVITRLANSGLLNRWYDQNNFRKVFNDDDDEDSVLEPKSKNSIRTLHNQFVAIAAVGYGIATLVFIGEILIHRILKWKRNTD